MVKNAVFEKAQWNKRDLIINKFHLIKQIQVNNTYTTDLGSIIANLILIYCELENIKLFENNFFFLKKNSTCTFKKLGNIAYFLENRINILKTLRTKFPTQLSPFPDFYNNYLTENYLKAVKLLNKNTYLFNKTTINYNLMEFSDGILNLHSGIFQKKKKNYN